MHWISRYCGLGVLVVPHLLVSALLPYYLALVCQQCHPTVLVSALLWLSCARSATSLHWIPSTLLPHYLIGLGVPSVTHYCVGFRTDAVPLGFGMPAVSHHYIGSALLSYHFALVCHQQCLTTALVSALLPCYLALVCQ